MSADEREVHVVGVDPLRYLGAVEIPYDGIDQDCNGSELVDLDGDGFDHPVEPLTDREEQVLVTVATGRTNAEIAHELNISLSTVKSRLASLMTKISARNRVEVALWAHETHRIKR